MAEYPTKRDPNRCPTHPGELLEDIIPATHKTKTEIAGLLGISRQHLYDILALRKPVSPNVAVRLGKLFGNGAELWIDGAYAVDTPDKKSIAGPETTEDFDEPAEHRVWR